ncbi:MAG: plasmid replication protein [Firmicutes bacterium]|nr:plasmid replication protein [Bacillota bacterium]
MLKKRNWGAVIYPESAPEDWKEILKLKGITFAVSPLHNKDIDPTGEIKKEHYHIIMCFQGPTSDNVVNQILKELNQPIAIALESVRGYYRYFTHKDNPDKYQYNDSEIELFNGFDVTDVLNNFEVYECLKAIQKLIVEHSITEYAELIDFLMYSEFFELWNVACSHTLFLNTYITSKRHALEIEAKKKETNVNIIYIMRSCIWY